MDILKSLKKKKEGRNDGRDESKAEVLDKSFQAKAGAPIAVPSVLRRPHLSEKAQGLQQINQYVFKVDPRANKSLIRREIEHRYGVKVKSINVLTEKAKPKRFRNQAGQRLRLAKTFVTLEPGQKIEIT